MLHSIITVFHMINEHWNTLIPDGSLEDELVKRLISEN